MDENPLTPLVDLLGRLRAIGRTDPAAQQVYDRLKPKYDRLADMYDAQRDNTPEFDSGFDELAVQLNESAEGFRLIEPDATPFGMSERPGLIGGLARGAASGVMQSVAPIAAALDPTQTTEDIMRSARGFAGQGLPSTIGQFGGYALGTAGQLATPGAALRGATRLPRALGALSRGASRILGADARALQSAGKAGKLLKPWGGSPIAAATNLGYDAAQARSPETAVWSAIDPEASFGDRFAGEVAADIIPGVWAANRQARAAAQQARQTSSRVAGETVNALPVGLNPERAAGYIPPGGALDDMPSSLSALQRADVAPPQGGFARPSAYEAQIYSPGELSPWRRSTQMGQSDDFLQLAHSPTSRVSPTDPGVLPTTRPTASLVDDLDQMAGRAEPHPFSMWPEATAAEPLAAAAEPILPSAFRRESSGLGRLGRQVPLQGGSASAQPPFRAAALGVGAAALAAPSIASAQSTSPSPSSEQPPARRVQLRRPRQDSERLQRLVGPAAIIAGMVGGAAGARALVSHFRPRARVPNAALTEGERIVDNLIAGETVSSPGAPSLGQRYIRSIAPIEEAERDALDELARLAPELRRVRDSDLPGLLAESTSEAGRRWESGLLGDHPVRLNEVTNRYEEAVEVPSFRAVLEPLSEIDRAKLSPYMLAARMTELADTRGLQLVDDDVLRHMRTVVAEAPQSVRVAADTLSNKYLRFYLDEWTRAGGLDPALAEKLADMYKFYIPLHKVLDEGGALAMERLGGLSVSQQVQRLKGFKNDFMDPLEAIVDYTGRMARATELLRPVRALADLSSAAQATAAKLGAKSVTEGVMTPLAAPSSRAAKKEAAELLALSQKLGLGLDADDAADIAGSLQRTSGVTQDRIATIWRNGKREYWKVAPNIAEALRALSPAELDIATQILGAPAQLLKAGVTLSPQFTAFNFIRDQFTALSQSRYGFANPLESLKALVTIYRSRATFGGESEFIDPVYRAFRAGGGGFGISRETAHPFAALESNLPGAIGARAKQRGRQHIVKQATSGRSYNLIHIDPTAPISSWRELLSPFEEATRFAAYKRARAAGASDLAARREARDITVNFGMRGSDPNMARLAHIIPFFNPAVQSLWRMQNAAFTKPGTFLVGGATVAGLSAYLWAQNRNDPRVRELRNTKWGSQYWYIPTGSEPEAPILRIPKPFLLGAMFGTGLEQVLDKLNDEDPMTAGELASVLAEQTSPSWSPTSMTLLAAMAGRNLTGQSIEPMGTEGLPREYRANADTPESLKAIYSRFGSILPGSPGKAEYILRQLFGHLGNEALRAADWVVNNQQVEAVERTPLIGNFFARYPSATTASLMRYYGYRRAAFGAQTALERLKKRAPQEVGRFLSRPRNVQLLAEAKAVAVGDKLMRDVVEKQAALEAANLPPAEKERRRRELYLEMQRIARGVNASIESLRAQESNREPR